MGQLAVIQMVAPAVAVLGLLAPLAGKFLVELGSRYDKRARLRRIACLATLAALAACAITILASWTETRADWVALASLILAFGFGLAGFRLRTSVAAKIALQLGVAAAAAILGERIPLHGDPHPIAETAVTIIFIVGVVNALIVLNFIDGLASLIVFAATGCIILTQDLTLGGGANPASILYALALCGGSLAFFMYKRPISRSYATDPGATFLGVSLALLIVRSWRVWDAGTLDPAVFLPLVLILPVLAASVHRERMALLRRQRLALILIVLGHLPAWIPIARQTGDVTIASDVNPMLAAVVSIASMTAWAGFVTQGRALRGWSLRLAPELIADVLRVAMVITPIELGAAVALGGTGSHLMFVLVSAAATTALLIAQVTWWRRRVQRGGAPEVVVFGDTAKFHAAQSIFHNCSDVFGRRLMRRSPVSIASKRLREALAEELRQGRTALIVDESARARIVDLRSLGDLVFLRDCLLLQSIEHEKSALSSGSSTSTTSAASRTLNAIIERAQDIVHRIIAALAMLALAPVFALVVLLIKLDDGGPVFFRQRRIGQHGKRFVLYKFRSMRVGSARYCESPRTERDDRVTRVGRMLRRLSIDELPQLYNVVRGDMRLVGPRPEMPFICAQYTSRERRRLEAPPGVTGLWQVSPHRNDPIHHHVEYDLAYRYGRGPVLDIALVIATIMGSTKGY